MVLDLLRMYLRNTNEAQILYCVWFKPIGGLHGFYRIEPTSLTIDEHYITMKGRTTFLVHFIMLLAQLICHKTLSQVTHMK